jgi:hypothetical protein
MDGMMIEQPPAGLLGWIAEYGNAVYFMAQLAYWLLMLFLLGYAVWQYKRWVNFQLGVGRSGKLRTDVESPAEDSKQAVSVEEFVE